MKGSKGSLQDVSGCRSMNLRSAALAGIVALVLSLCVAYLTVVPMYAKVQLINYLGIVTFAGFFSVFYLKGFACIGERTRNATLKQAAYMFIALTVLNVGYMIIITALDLVDNQYATMTFLFFYGALAIMFGAGLYRLYDELGNVAKAAGVLNIAAGILTLTYFLLGVGALLGLAAEVMNIALMFKAARYYR